MEWIEIFEGVISMTCSKRISALYIFVKAIAKLDEDKYKFLKSVGSRMFLISNIYSLLT